MKKRTVLIVPPRGVPLKAFRIRLFVAFFLAAVVVAGFTGLVLPFDFLTRDAAEQNYRKNLIEQNRALLQKIITTLRMLKDLKGQIARLEQHRRNVVEVSGNEGGPSAKPQGDIDFTLLESDELLSYIEKIEARFSPFIMQTSDSGNRFDSIPVLPPIPLPAVISRRFGMALDPFSGKKRFHNGTDFIAESGTPVMATAAGIVQRIEKHAIWGKKVVIKHGSGYSTTYAHLGAIATSQGKQVERGETIGEIGLSGLTSGPHVHYEIRCHGKAVDPEAYFFPHELVNAQ
ncbi:MAG: peptidoglycan DD-metalloendopeptidase family protein [Chitinispirillaceae bacterium]|nr:peptidoglycan DD-metalloendopeptidase family protein [Chitinispirillaceae bacterium]